MQVVADYDTPVFYSGGQYWRHNDGGWYASSTYTGGWAYRASPPSVIVHIDRPERFVHFRPKGYVAHNHPAPQREWHPASLHGEVHVEAPRADVRVEPPRAQVRIETPNVNLHVEPPRATVHVDGHADVRASGHN